MSFFWYFAMYGASKSSPFYNSWKNVMLMSAAVTYIVLYHRQQIVSAGKLMWRSALKTLRIRRHQEEEEDELDEDIHYRLMQQYNDVPEWVYFIVLVTAMIIGMVGIAIYPTQTSPVVVLFGIIMPLIALIPIGLVQSVTGIQVAMNVLAEFIGGSFVEGQFATEKEKQCNARADAVRQCQCTHLVQDIRIHLVLPGSQLLERSQVGSLHQNPSLVHLLVSDGRHLNFHIRQQWYSELPNVVQGRLYPHCRVRFHVPWYVISSLSPLHRTLLICYV